MSQENTTDTSPRRMFKSESGATRKRPRPARIYVTTTILIIVNVGHIKRKFKHFFFLLDLPFNGLSWDVHTFQEPSAVTWQSSGTRVKMAEKRDNVANAGKNKQTSKQKKPSRPPLPHRWTAASQVVGVCQRECVCVCVWRNPSVARVLRGRVRWRGWERRKQKHSFRIKQYFK